MRKAILCAAIACLALPAFPAGISLVKTIDLGTNVPGGSGGVKDIAADASGNLYYTTYFGVTDHTIRKITNPLGAETVADWSVGPTYPTSNGSYLAIDAAGNVYLTGYTSVADAFVRKYKSDGTLDATFGVGGVVSPIQIGGVDHRPRAIFHTGAPDNKLVVASFKTAPLQLFTVDASTGALGATVVDTPGDPTENGLNNGNDIWSGIAYDPATKTLYGNAQCDLVTLTGASSTLNDLTTFNTRTFLTRHGRRNTDDNDLAFDAASGLIAYSVRQNAVSLQDQRVALYEIATGRETVVGDIPGTDNNISGYTGLAFFRSSGNLYLAATGSASKAIKIFLVDTTPAPAPSWTWEKRVDISSVLPTGARAKNIDTDSVGNIFFGAFYAPSQIYKLTDPAGSASVAVWQTDSHPSTSANVVTIDEGNNLYYASQGADAASSYIKKYNSSGSLVASFGTGGTLSPVVVNGVQVRPRSIAYAGGRLIVTPFTGAPEQIGTVDALTGADGGVAIDAPGNKADTATVGGTELWQGATYDSAANAIYGNAMGTLVKLTGASATFANLASFNTVTPVVVVKRTSSDQYWLKKDPTSRWIAFSSFREYSGTPTVFVTKTAIYEPSTGKVEFVGGPPPVGDGTINENGAPAFFTVGATQYLATLSQRDSAIDLWKYVGPASVNDWSMY